LEFGEKLQYLRKQKELTQEQLADQLFVSRTAISKWESGKGYPNIESLKCLAAFFSVSIDELLSGEELISLAETENHDNLEKLCGFIYALLDVLVISGIFLPLYGEPDGGYIRAVNLLKFTNTSIENLILYWVVLLLLFGLGIVQFVLIHFEKEKWRRIIVKCSLGVEIFTICFLSAAREPYLNVFIFLLLGIKIFILIKQTHSKV